MTKNGYSFKFNIKNMDVMDIEIINMNGQTVMKQLYYPSTTGAQSAQFNIQHLIPGAYMLRVKQNNKVSGVQKLLINHL